jgi:hypothetical protein
MRTAFINRAFILAAATLFAAAGAAAQTPAGQHEQHHPQAQQQWERQVFQYDRTVETTVRGTIQNVTQQKQERLGKGTHITLRGDDGRIHNVYLGPRDFLQQRQLQTRRGEQVELTGAPTMIEGRQVMLVREARLNGRTVTLRTMEGMPQWEAAADRIATDPMYDRGAETTLRGEVESVILRTRPDAEQQWLQAAIRTDEGQRTFVHFGPRDFMNRQAFRIRQGDRIEVTGSNARIGTEDFLVARQVTRGDQSFALRSPEGHPQWGEPGRADREATHYPQAHREAAEWPQVQDRQMAERMETGVSYDRQRETTIRGAVQDFRVHDRPGVPASSHVTIRTDDGRTVTVLMGPAEHLRQHGIQLRQGSQVQVTGSMMDFEGRNTILARQVQSEGRTVSVRDQAGQPQWQVEREHQMHHQQR